jgi:hypothetical protein
MSPEGARTHDAAVFAEENAGSLTQPTDIIPWSMKWPQSRHQDDAEDEGTHSSQQLWRD